MPDLVVSSIVARVGIDLGVTGRFLYLASHTQLPHLVVRRLAANLHIATFRHNHQFHTLTRSYTNAAFNKLFYLLTSLLFQLSVFNSITLYFVQFVSTTTTTTLNYYYDDNHYYSVKALKGKISHSRDLLTLITLS